MGRDLNKFEQVESLMDIVYKKERRANVRLFQTFSLIYLYDCQISYSIPLLLIHISGPEQVNRSPLSH